MAAMCVQLFLVALGFTVFIAGPLASAGSSLFISHSPDYVRFKKEAGQIATSEIGGLISSTFGHSLSKNLKWSGLEQGSLFHRPKANILLTLEGVQDININHIAKFPVNADEVIVDTATVANRLGDRPQGEKSFIVDFSENNVFDMRSRHPKQLSMLPATMSEVRDHIVGDKSAFTGLTIGSLNMTRDADAAFLGELQVIYEIIAALQVHKVLVKDNYPDLFHFRLGAMHQLTELYGARSQPLFEAYRLLNTFVNRMTEDFKALYGGHVVMEIVALPDVDSRVHVHKARSLMEADTPTAPKSIEKLFNIETAYNGEYAAIFNIILWTMIFLVLIVAAVSYSMWTMDPGRDSIIYRMTSQRIKKD